jgi:hypothetical protein
MGASPRKGVRGAGSNAIVSLVTQECQGDFRPNGDSKPVTSETLRVSMRRTQRESPSAQRREGALRTWSGKRESNPRPSAWEGARGASSDADLRQLPCRERHSAAQSGTGDVAEREGVAMRRLGRGAPRTAPGTKAWRWRTSTLPGPVPSLTMRPRNAQSIRSGWASRGKAGSRQEVAFSPGTERGNTAIRSIVLPQAPGCPVVTSDGAAAVAPADAGICSAG